MSHDQLHDFSVGSEAGKPEHVGKMKDPPPPGSVPFSATQAMPEATNVAPMPPMLKGSSPDIMGTNANSLKQAGQSELNATKMAIRGAGKSHPHKNLGSWLHPKKG